MSTSYTNYSNSTSVGSSSWLSNAGQLAMSGVFSGINTDDIVSKLSAMNQQPVTDLQNKKAAAQQQKNAVTSIQNALENFQTTADALRDAGKLRAVQAASSDGSILSATTGTGANEGFHSIEVNRLARAQQLVNTAGVASSDAKVGQGAFVYSYGGVKRTLYTTATTTLSQLRDSINNDGSNPGVTASILQYNGTAHLVLSGNDTGEDHTITIDDALTLDAFDTATFTQTQAAQDAQYRVDNYPPGDWMTSDSNTLSDVVAGATIQLKSEGTASVTMSRDTSAVAGLMNNFVNAYNVLMSTASSYTGYNTDTKSGGVLQGDSTLQSMLSPIRGLLTAPTSGFSRDSDTFTMASQLGLQLDKTGKLSLDSATFTQALQQDYLGVLSVIGAVNSGASDNDAVAFTSAMSSTRAGTYDVAVTYDATGQITAAKIRLKGQEVWDNASVSGQIITGAAGTAEAGLELTAAWDSAQGAYTATAQVRVREGFAGQIYDKTDALLKPITGAIAQRESSYDDKMASIQRNIDLTQQRVDLATQALKAKYQRMEATLAQLDSQRAAVEAATQSLASNTNSMSNSNS